MYKTYVLVICKSQYRGEDSLLKWKLSSCKQINCSWDILCKLLSNSPAFMCPSKGPCSFNNYCRRRNLHIIMIIIIIQNECKTQGLKKYHFQNYNQDIFTSLLLFDNKHQDTCGSIIHFTVKLSLDNDEWNGMDWNADQFCPLLQKLVGKKRGLQDGKECTPSGSIPIHSQAIQ